MEKYETLGILFGAILTLLVASWLVGKFPSTQYNFCLLDNSKTCERGILAEINGDCAKIIGADYKSFAYLCGSFVAIPIK